MSNVPLINKYRPAAFDEIVGHEVLMGGLKRVLASDSTPHAYLFTGPAGLGKTTTARIVASHFNAELSEIDAAANNGIDAMRQLIDLGGHMALTGEGNRAFIIDECHALSKAAWQSILKLLEEPPDHLYLLLCTTELDKVPETIRSRCYHVALKRLNVNEMTDLLDAIASLEGWDVHPDVMMAVIEAATGQPRKGISMLQSVHDLTSRDEVRRVISLQEDSEPLLEIARMAINGVTDWPRYAAELRKTDDAAWEGAAVPVGRYFMAVMDGAKDNKKAAAAWKLLDALTFPTNTFDRKAAFYAALGRMLFA